MEQKKSSIFDSFVEEARSISKKFVSETSRTYQSFKINMDITNLKKRQRERMADLGLKVFQHIKQGTLTVPGIEYLISELKALEFQIKLKEEDLIDMTAKEVKPTAEKKKEPAPPKPAAKPEPPKSAEPAKKPVQPKKDVETVKLEPEKAVKKAPPKPAKKKAAPKKKSTAKKKATAKKDDAVSKMSALKGIGPKLAETFAKAGYNSVKKLADADPKQLAKLLNRTEKTAQKYIDIAKKG